MDAFVILCLVIVLAVVVIAVANDIDPPDINFPYFD